jgi:OOP family OmpA-OmpF porin
MQNARADAEAGQGYFSIMGSYIDDDSSRGLEDAINGGQLGLGYVVNDALNIEAMLSVATPKASQPGRSGEEHTALGVDLQWVFRRNEDFSPYLLAGLSTFNIDPSGSENDLDGAAFSAGAGFYLNPFKSNVAIRGEFRRRLENASSDVGRWDGLRDSLFSLGLQIPFGPATPKWVDTDGDGVEDGSDNCPNTPAGAKVDAWGCELDSDGDGVKDSKDQCPGTPRGVAVDANGCPNDSDGDGVSDDMDECPGTPAGQPVDAKGCELDDDGDGVINRLDECPGTPPGTPVDRKGCELKGDYTLQGVNFETNSDRLVSGASAVLNLVAETLLKYPEIKVEVQGHTDSDGAAAYNESLSSRRAQTVRDYLASKGVDAGRMTVRGYGESAPVADNTTAAGKAQNRRVVLRILED